MWSSESSACVESANFPALLELKIIFNQSVHICFEATFQNVMKSELQMLCEWNWPRPPRTGGDLYEYELVQPNSELRVR